MRYFLVLGKASQAGVVGFRTEDLVVGNVDKKDVEVNEMVLLKPMSTRRLEYMLDSKLGILNEETGRCRN